MNMKKSFIGILTIALLLSSCGTSQSAAGDPNAVATGALIGSNVGGAIGSLIGESNNGWRGSYRGSAIGTIVGALAGAAIANAATAPKKQETNDYRIEDVRPGRQEMPSGNAAFERLKIRNIRFIDSNRNQTVNSEESCKIIFEVVNEGNRTAYNVVPLVTETTGMKRIHISSSVMVEQIASHDGIKYTANLQAGERIKTGEIVIHIAVTDEYGNEYDWQEFALPTQR